jgi:hypothetical protein
MEFILLAGALFGVWDIARQRHAILNSGQTGVWDDPAGVERFSHTVQEHIYHPEQNKVNSDEVLTGRWAWLYASRQARGRTSITRPELDRSIYHQNNYMSTSRSRFIDEPISPATHADFSDDGRGRLLMSNGMIVNNVLVRV